MAMMMTLRKPILPLFTAALTLAGCAKDQGDYPSLSIRDAERVSGTFQPVAPEPFIPAPQPAQALQLIDSLRIEAGAAHSRFTAAGGRVRTQVNAARNASRESEAWIVAQIAIADLESIRSEAMIPLAELDRIYVEAQAEEKSTAEVEIARNQVEALVRAEDELIESLKGSLVN